MSISTYAELKTAIDTWTQRANLTAVSADLITLAESRLNRVLRLRGMENSATVSTSISDRFATLPTGFLEAIDLALYVNNVPQILTQVPLVSINAADLTTATQPHFYAISSNIIFDVTSDQVYSCTFRYYKKLDIATDLTNFLLTAYPDVYLNAAIVEAFVYGNNPARAQIWEMRLQESINSLNRLEGRTRGRAKMLTEINGYQMRENIITGDR